MNNGAAAFIVQLLPLVLMQAVLLFAVVPLAMRSGKMTWLWVLFALVPGFGVLAFPLLLGRGVAALLGRTEALLTKIDTKQ